MNYGWLYLQLFSFDHFDLSLQSESYYITYIKGHEWSRKHRVLRSHRSKMSNIWSNIHLSYFCEIWVLCVVDHLWPLILRSLPSLLSTLFSLVPAMCNRTSCAQVHELPQTHCGGNQEGTLLLWLHIYIYIKSRAHGLKTDGIKGKEALRGDWKGLNKEAYM